MEAHVKEKFVREFDLVFVPALRSKYKCVYGRKNTADYVEIIGSDYGRLKFFYREDRLYFSRRKKYIYNGLDWIKKRLL